MFLPARSCNRQSSDPSMFSTLLSTFPPVDMKQLQQPIVMVWRQAPHLSAVEQRVTDRNKLCQHGLGAETSSAIAKPKLSKMASTPTRNSLHSDLNMTEAANTFLERHAMQFCHTSIRQSEHAADMVYPEAFVGHSQHLLAGPTWYNSSASREATMSNVLDVVQSSACSRSCD